MAGCSSPNTMLVTLVTCRRSYLDAIDPPGSWLTAHAVFDEDLSAIELLSRWPWWYYCLICVVVLRCSDRSESLQVPHIDRPSGYTFVRPIYLQTVPPRLPPWDPQLYAEN